MFFGDIRGFFSLDGLVSFEMHLPNGVSMVMQPCAEDFASLVRFALLRGGFRTVHPDVPVVTVGGICTPLRVFFSSYPFTRMNFVECGKVTCVTNKPSLPAVVITEVVCGVDASCETSEMSCGESDASDSSDSSGEFDAAAFVAAMDSLKEDLLSSVAGSLKSSRGERVAQLRSERDRLRTWMIVDATATLSEVLLCPPAPAHSVNGWKVVHGIFLPALEQYSRYCSGDSNLVLKSAYVYSDVEREKLYIDVCSRMDGSVSSIPRVWSCGDGQFLMWRSGDTSAEWKMDELAIDVGVNIPVSPRRLGVYVYVCPRRGAKSATIVRSAVGNCAKSPSNATDVHDSVKCTDTAYMVLDASAVLPAFRLDFL